MNLIFALTLFPTPMPAVGEDATTCEDIARLAARATQMEIREDLLLGIANCINGTDSAETMKCLAEAAAEAMESMEEGYEVLEARLDLCDDLDEDVYDPEISPEDFVEGIDNPFLPYTVGSTWDYELEFEEDGERLVEEIHVEVLEDTREILGIECTVVRDTVSIDGELIEDTFDYYAQDVDGNVWYFGEISMNYEDGYLTDLDGSWVSGEEFAKPGILMWADAMVGSTYRQEFLLDEAEDAGVFLSDSELVSTPVGDFADCRLIEDFTPLEPDVEEYKYFAPGVGLVRELDLESGEELVLLAYDVK